MSGTCVSKVLLGAAFWRAVAAGEGHLGRAGDELHVEGGERAVELLGQRGRPAGDVPREQLARGLGIGRRGHGGHEMPVGRAGHGQDRLRRALERADLLPGLDVP